MTISPVRLADPTDEAALVDLLHEMHGEDGIGRFDPATAIRAIRAGTARSGGLVGVIRGIGGIEATIGLFLGTSRFSHDPHLFDLWSFVSEAHRKSTHAKALIQFAKTAAIDLQLPLLMTVISNEQTARKERLFERQLPRGGSLFLFNAVPMATANVEAPVVLNA